MRNLMGLMNEAAFRKLIESSIPKEYKKGMKIAVAGKEDMLLSADCILQQTYSRFVQGTAGDRENELIGLLINIVQSWSTEELKAWFLASIRDWFKQLNRIDCQEDNKQQNRITILLLIGYVLSERTEKNV